MKKPCHVDWPHVNATRAFEGRIISDATLPTKAVGRHVKQKSRGVGPKSAPHYNLPKVEVSCQPGQKLGQNCAVLTRGERACLLYIFALDSLPSTLSPRPLGVQPHLKSSSSDRPSRSLKPSLNSTSGMVRPERTLSLACTKSQGGGVGESGVG